MARRKKIEEDEEIKIIERKIWKYPIPNNGEFTIPLPCSFDIVHTEMNENDGHPNIWISFTIEDGEDLNEQKFRIIGTGEPWDHQKYTYQSTWNDGPFFWHLLSED